MTNQPTRPDLVIEADLVAEQIAAAPVCPHCRSVKLVHVSLLIDGDLDLNVVVGHEPGCVTQREAPEVRQPHPYDEHEDGTTCTCGRLRGDAMHTEPATPLAASVTDLSFRLGEQFGRIGAKLDQLLRAYGIDPDGPEVAAAEAALTTKETA